MLHRTAELTPSGRQLLVQRILIEGWPPATAAEMLGVSRATAYKWMRRYRAEGLAGLEDRSARPRRRPRRADRARRSAGSCSRGVGCASARIAWGRCSAIRARPCTASCDATGSAGSPMPTG